MTSQWSRRAWFKEWLFLAGLASVCAALLGAANGLGRTDRTLYDVLVSRHTLGAPEDIVIVAIDDESLRALGRWPWRRAVLATLIERVAAARPLGVAVDLILADLDVRDPSGDLHLAAALKTHARLVLPMNMVPGMSRRPEPLLPAQPFLESGPRLGHAHFEVDPDGIVRSVFLKEGAGERSWPALALAMVQDELPAAPSGQRNPSPRREGDTWSRDHWIHLAFSGPPGTVARIPAVRVLTGEFRAAELAGKYVFIGSTATGLGDAYPTPVTGGGELMPGVEMHAQVAHNLLRDRAIRMVSPLASAAFTVLPVWAALIGFLFLGPRRALEWCVGLMLLTLGVAWAGIALASVWVPPSAAILVLGACYPLWSWKRLEAALAYLSEEFSRLRGEPTIVPQSPAPSAALQGDLVERRIESVRQAADSLRHARRFIADSIEHLPVATVVLDLDDRLLMANRLAARCFASGGPERLYGAPFEPLLAEFAPGQPGLWQRVRNALAQGAAQVIEITDRASRRYLMQAAHCVNAAGTVVGYLVTLADITAIREAERRRDETLAFVSHDLRSPQVSILAAVQLNKFAPEEHPAGKALEQIEQYAWRTIVLAENFVELARAETGKLRSRPCDLGEIAREALAQLQPQAQGKSIGLELRAGGATTVTGDHDLLLRAVVNLAGNAIKYSPSGTSVTVTVAREGNLVHCRVRDHGYGISDEDQKRLFQNFARVSAPGQPRAKGIGLGLAFVKAVIERHGGEVTLTSRLGEGSEFGFALGFDEAPADAADANAE